MAMTAKHYLIVAGVFYKEFLELGGDGKQYSLGRADEWRTLVILMANQLALHDNKFNKDKFMKECGL